MFSRLKTIIVASDLRLNIGMTLGRQILAAGVQLLVVVLIARNLGPEGNGFYAMAILSPAILANFLNFGIGSATVYFVSRRQFSAKQAAWENTKLALVISGVGVAIALPILCIWGEQLFPGIPISLLFIGLAGFPLSLYLAFNSSVLQGLQDFRAFNATVLLPPIVSLIVVPVAFYALNLGIYGALSAYILGQLTACITVYLFLRKRLVHSCENLVANLAGSVTYYKAVLNYGGKAHLSNVITFINYRADIFLVNLFLTPALVGVYAIAVQISEKLWLPSQAVSTVLFPKLSTMGDHPADRLRLTNKAFFLVSGITAVFSCLTAIVLHLLIVPVFGKEYLAMFPAFYWLLPGIVCWAGARVQSNCIAAAGKPEWNMYQSFAVLVINLAGNLFLIPQCGIVGAAMATSMAYVFDAIVKVYLVNRIEHGV